ncbi:MAG TPA: SURF1 family protein [Usitatibacter sp.]|nr:SURF1 family protein [Usitatibacter sp.]
MRIGAFAFNPSPWPTVGAALFTGLTIYLGVWQTHRGDEKEARQRLLDERTRETPVVLAGSGGAAEALLYRKVRASGEYDPAGQIYIDNQVHQGRAGYFVVTPLRLRDGTFVLVNRGWIARGPAYPQPPPAAVPAGAVVVTGLAMLPPARVLELGPQTVSGSVWQNLSIDRYRDATRKAVAPVVVLADAADFGLVAVHEAPDAGVARHREYALTWFSLAFTTLVLWVALNLKRVR